MNGKMMSTNRKNYRGRQIIFALIAFSIASMIMASIINNTNNVNNNLLAFAKKKHPGGSTTTTTTTDPKKTDTKKKSTSASTSSSSSGGGSGSSSHHIKIKQIKKTNIPSGGGVGGVVGITDNGNGINGNPGGNGNSTGQGGNGGKGTTIKTTTGNPPPPVKCKSGEVLKGGVCVIVATRSPVCKSGEVLSYSSCVPKTPITCTPDQILMKGKCVPKPVDCKLTPGVPECVQPLVDCKKTPIDPKCVPDCTKTPTYPKCPQVPPCDPKTDIKCPCPTGQHRDSNNQCVPDTTTPCPAGQGLLNGQCVRCETPDSTAKVDADKNLKTADCDKSDANETPCPGGSVLINGVCQCPSHEHFDNRIKKCIRDTPHIPAVIHIIVKGVPRTIVHDFTEFTINPTHNKVVIILPTRNVQDATTKDMNIFGTILNTGSATVKSVGEVRATIFDKDNNTLATLTAVAAAQQLKPQSTTTFQLVISPSQVKLTDVKFIEFELVPLRTGSASVASSSSS
jgi:hypothetical protein